MREYSIHPSEDIRDLPLGLLFTAWSLSTQRQPARKVFLTRKCIASPVKRVSTVVDCTAALWWIMYSAEILPLGCTHLRAGLRRAGRNVTEESNKEVVGFNDEDAAKLVKPEGAINAVRGSRDLLGGFSCDGLSRGRGGFRVLMPKGFKVYLQSEWGIDLKG